MASLQQLLCWGFSEEVVNVLNSNDIDFKTLLQMTRQDFDTFNIGITLGNRIRLYKCMQDYKRSINVPESFETDHNVEILSDANAQNKMNSSFSANNPELDVKPLIKDEVRDIEFIDMPQHSCYMNEDAEIESVLKISQQHYENEPSSNHYLKRKAENAYNSKELIPPQKKNVTDSMNCLQHSVHCRHNENSSAIFPQSFKLNEDNICKESIETVLKDSLEGEAILTEYKTTGTLKESSRNLLVSLLINRCDVKSVRRPPAFLQSLSKIIVDLLPNESQDIYFIAANSNGNVSKNARGKLTSKWKNVIFRMRSAGLLEKRTVTVDETFQPSTSCEVNDEGANDVMLWLQNNREPWDDVRKYWETTYEYRRAKCVSIKSADILIQQWPILKSPLGPRLVQLDFDRQYPGKNLIIEDKWESFFNTLYNLRRNNLRDESVVSLCKLYEKLAVTGMTDLDGLRVLILPYLVPPTTRVKTPVGIKKPCTIECAEGFVVWTKAQNTIISTLQARTERYQALQLPPPPCILLVGCEISNIEATYVFVGQFLWKVNSPRFAIDLLIKLFFVFNISYPFDCEQVWLLIQKCLYNIHLENDKKIGIVSSILASIANKT